MGVARFDASELGGVTRLQTIQGSDFDYQGIGLQVPKPAANFEKSAPAVTPAIGGP